MTALKLCRVFLKSSKRSNRIIIINPYQLSRKDKQFVYIKKPHKENYLSEQGANWSSFSWRMWHYHRRKILLIATPFLYLAKNFARCPFIVMFLGNRTINPKIVRHSCNTLSRGCRRYLSNMYETSNNEKSHEYRNKV